MEGSNLEPQSRCPWLLTWCARVLVTVDVQSLHGLNSLRLLDQSSLAAHLSLMFILLDLPGVHYTQQELERCTRCTAKVLTQTALQLAVRAQQRRPPDEMLSAWCCD